jgi:hypothetical protein
MTDLAEPIRPGIHPRQGGIDFLEERTDLKKRSACGGRPLELLPADDELFPEKRLCL